LSAGGHAHYSRFYAPGRWVVIASGNGSSHDQNSVPLDPTDADGFRPTADRRPIIPEPPPVRLVTVDDAVLIAAPGQERALDAFYVGVLRFEREDAPPPARQLVEPVLGPDAPRVPPVRVVRPLPRLHADAIQGAVYRAENARVSFQVHEPLIERDSLRALKVEVPSLAGLAGQLEQREIEFTRQKGLYPGHESLLLSDPAGNWLEVSENRPI
jgi:hypothetical protein